METGFLHIIISHGPEKYRLQVTSSEPSNNVTVLDLKEEAFKVTGVEPDGQKLIFKGKQLSDPARSLKSYGIVSGNKLMLMGNKNSLERNPQFQQVESVEKNMNSVKRKQLSIVEELQGIEQGYLPENLVQDSLQKLKKRLAACNEEYVRLLEMLDSLTLSGGPASLRSKRKAAVQEIQQYLNENDQLKERISQQTDRFR